MKKTAIAAGLIAIMVPFSSALADVTENRDVDAFTKVEFDGLMEVTITVGEEQSVTITANSEKYLKNVETRVRGGTLRVDMDWDEDRGFFSFLRDVEVKIEITVPTLDGVEMEGLGDLVIKNVDADDFWLSVDGMGTVDIDGRCKSATFEMDGMGDLNAKNFKCERVRVSIDGMGDAEVFASEYVDVSLDGFGDVDVYGDPDDSRVDLDGMGSVDFK
ncbi:MAG: head GIN domain-containing protein [Alphaproteobacteria bacterium]